MDTDKAQVISLTAESAGRGEDRQASQDRPIVLAIERWFLRRMLQSLGSPPVGLVLWDGTRVESETTGTVATVVLHDRGALYRLLRNPSFQFGELYGEGRLSVEGSLVSLLEVISSSMAGSRFYQPKVTSPRRRLRLNNLAGARRNIHHHYDIGNDFYKLWLDERMVYTCAYFPDPAMSLEAAQFAKMEHVSRKLRLRPGERVIEAGCGWGALALHMARHHGVRVLAFNISREQVEFARRRARDQGLADRVEFVEDDYRNIPNHAAGGGASGGSGGSGGCDAFVSVGMLEHVGPEHYHELGAVIDRCLAPHGRGLIHSIGRNRPIPISAWIAARIFPGGYTPALSEMTRLFEPYSFSVLDVENLRLHYALTLRHWLQRFEAARDQIRAGFDDAFVRTWRLYLAGSQAAFTTGWMQLFQVVFTRAQCNTLPWSREHLYRNSNDEIRMTNEPPNSKFE